MGKGRKRTERNDLGIELTHYIRDIHACCQPLSLIQNIHKLLYI